MSDKLLKDGRKKKKLKPSIIPLQKIVQESIKKENCFKPFWNNYSKKMSKAMWLPNKNDKYFYFDGNQNSTEKSCFCKKTTLKYNNKKSSCILKKFLHPDVMDIENVKYTRKIRIYPNKDQRDLFEKCFNGHRFFYNKTVRYINDNENVNLSLITIRPLVMNNDKKLKTDEKWQKEIPNDTRQLAISEAITAFKSSHALLKKGIIKHFKVSYKSKKMPVSNFHITKKALKPSFHLFKRRLKKKIRVRSKIKRWIKNNINEIDHQCQIIKEKPNRYYICIPRDRKKENIKKPFNIVSLDPGVKTFQTFYSPDGICGKLGNNVKNDLSKISIKIDKLKSKIENKNTKCKTRRNLKRRCFLLRNKIKNKVKDLHWKSISYLCKNFENIIIPSFETSNMTSCKNRKIGKKTTNEMLTLSHYRFRERLIYKSECYTKCKVYICKEDYTSKTCTKCGNVDMSLGGKKIYKCKECNLILDRDINGARNILIKVLSSEVNRLDPTDAFICKSVI